ncbi:hypothetical protein K1T71_015086 [Dendrolimus kikuchii]|nr:hypothetical protein K1T71_015086 [Dendrolimus kikuchii]
MATNYFKLQENILGQIVKSKSNFKKTPKERLNLCYVETRLDNLEQHWTDFTSNDQRIVMEFKKEELEVSSYVLNDIYNSAEEYYIEYKALLKDQLRKLNPESVSDKCSTGQQQLSVKLPKIEIPKFSGKYAEWASFRNLFTSLIHKNGNIDNVQKLHYLKSSVTGEAEQLLRHIPVTSDNYLICWSQLESRYNNKKFLANCILKKLINQKVLTTESSTSIKQLLDTTKECLYGLQNLGVDISSWDIIVIFLVSQKLDPESRKLWEQKVTESAQELPSLTMFEDYLENRYRSIEFLDPKVQKQDKPNCNHVTTTTVINCSFCSDGHKLANCKKFSRETIDVRRAFVQSNHLCFNCLNADHTVFQCNMSTRCRLCKKKHHTLLHPKTPKSVIDHINTDQSLNKSVVATTTTSTSQTQSESTGTPTITSYFSNTPSQVLLATALVKAESPRKNMTIVLKSLLDQGSQASFVTESAVQLLGLKRIPETSTISGLGGDRDSTIASKFTVVLNLQSRIDSTFKLSVKAHVLKKLTCFLPSRQVRVLPQLASLELADPWFGIPNKIDLLLGAEVYSQILLEGLVKGLPGSVIAQNTRLGWILSGKTDTSNCLSDVNQSAKGNVISMHIVDATNNDLLKKFWEMELEPSSYKAKHLTPEEQSCETLFSQSTCRDKSGRYIVKLPFKSQDPLCKYGNSKEIARKRFFVLEKRLFRNPELKREYSKVMNEYVHLGHMEVVSNPDKSDAVYLPHHAVVKQDKITSRVRVVFDASCSGSNGVSLNNDLMTGPTLQPELRHLVMRWRRFPIALVADIVKMYRQVKVSESDTAFQRIYWREDPDQDLQQFRLLRVTFGTSPAPFLAVRCLQQLACDEGADFPLAAQRVLCDFYMDDLISGTHSVDQGVLIHKQMIGLLKRGCFPLQKWSSNNADLMSHISKGNNIPEDLELKTDEELGDVLNACIKRCQNQYFDTDLAKYNKLSSLNPFRDNNGIWRVGGRLQHASLSEDRKHPILIPRQSHIAKLIIANAHEKTLHGGPQLTINYIHSKYWIVNLRNLVKSYVHKCVTCIRYSSTTVHPLMGQLPTARVTTSRPFLQSGLDYAGPIAVRTTKGRGHKATKGYICLFICMATRAIHLEVVSDLTSDAFLAAFKRFVARRGHCNELWSDNATTFVGADRELKTLLESERSAVATDIADWLSTNGTTWHRIPPYSPNFGGLWEAGVKSTKGHLKKVVGDTTLTFEELTTVLAQIEAYSDDASPLTPGHFLVGEPLVLIPDANYEYANITSLKRWQLTQRMVQEFWRRWSREYLTQFLQRNKWKERTSEPEIGDIVLVKEDNLPPARWLYGIITDKHSGLDNVTRVVSLRCKDTIIKRPVSKIVKLPVT